MGQQRPGVTFGAGFFWDGFQALNEVISIIIGPKYCAPFNTTANVVLQHAWSIYTIYAWHEKSSTITFVNFKVIFS